MTSSWKHLERCISLDLLPSEISTLNDYGFINCDDKKEEAYLLGVYKGADRILEMKFNKEYTKVNVYGSSQEYKDFINSEKGKVITKKMKNMFHEACINNSVDKLIHHIYKYGDETEYYEWFCSKKDLFMILNENARKNYKPEDHFPDPNDKNNDDDDENDNDNYDNEDDDSDYHYNDHIF